LGEGAFARVWKVRHKKTKKYYAAKSIPKAKLDGDLRKTAFRFVRFAACGLSLASRVLGPRTS
jgi:hypothetical protein